MGSPSISPVNTMVDWSDSLYYYVRQRIKALNPSRNFGGIVDAQDWPTSEAQIGAFYMLTGIMSPVRTSAPGGNSWSGPSYTEGIQWVWQLIGTDIPKGAVVNNRGDRYRQQFQMRQELLTGIYPGYAQLNNYTVDQASGVFTVTPYSPSEFVRFSKPQFSERIDSSTGIMFGSASMQISSFGPRIDS